MADQVAAGGLVAVDGSRGNDVANAADALAAEIREHGGTCVISRWDASGLFGEFGATDTDDPSISARTLSLLYAADLAFRLRWEIKPALLEGQVVIAAPYLDTAIAMGTACGLPEAWLSDLLRFAPAPAYAGLARERKEGKGWKARRDRGYAEYGALMLEATAPRRVSKAARRRMMEMLDRTRGRKLFHLSTKGIGLLQKALIDSRKDAPRRSASRPRNGRK